MFSKRRHTAMDAIHGNSHRGGKMFVLGAILGAATAIVCNQKNHKTSRSSLAEANAEMDDPFTNSDQHSTGVDPLAPH